MHSLNGVEMKVASIETVRQIEANVDKSIMNYQQMMLNAGRASGEYLCQQLDITNKTRITLLIGKGNNGGDGLVVAHYLSQNTSAQIRLYMLAERTEDDANYQAVVDAELFIAQASHDNDSRLLQNMICSADIIIDALFGIGVRLPIRDVPAKVMRTVNQMLKSNSSSYGETVAVNPTQPHQLASTPQPFIYAIDCPSGMDCDTGEADSNTISADMTMTFITAKHGQFTFPAARYVGELVVSQIGIPDTQTDITSLSHFIIDNEVAKHSLPNRPVDGHKGTFGKTFIIAGSNNYIGATSLSAESAYRSGAGLVTMATTTPIIETIASQLREPTFIHLPNEDGAISASAYQSVKTNLDGYSALLIGCGLGQHPSTQSFVKQLLSSANLPSLIIDADALNTLSQTEHWWENLPPDSIITPHPGEMARLTGLSTTEINGNRWNIASEKAKEWGVIVVLKGAHTLIASPEGQVGVIPFKTDALATAGTGDVLAGLIAGLRTQGASAFESALAGAYVHALAGQIVIQQIGSSRAVIARDILNAIGLAFGQIES